MTILKFVDTYWMGQNLMFQQPWGCDSFFGIRIQQIIGDENRASFWRQSTYFIDKIGNILYSGLYLKLLRERRVLLMERSWTDWGSNNINILSTVKSYTKCLKVKIKKIFDVQVTVQRNKFL